VTRAQTLKQVQVFLKSQPDGTLALSTQLNSSKMNNYNMYDS